MDITFLLVALGVLSGSGLLALISGRSAAIVGAGGAVVGCVLGLVPAVVALTTGVVSSVRAPWQVPGGSFFVELDALSAFFLLPILGLSALAALYGSAYLSAYRDRKWLGPPCFFFER